MYCIVLYETHLVVKCIRLLETSSYGVVLRLCFFLLRVMKFDLLVRYDSMWRIVEKLKILNNCNILGNNVENCLLLVVAERYRIVLFYIVLH